MTKNILVWKMFTTIFAFTLVIAYAAAEIPSYIHICSRSDPKIDQCILNNVNNLKPKICKGIPELDIPSNDPFIIDSLALVDAPNIKVYAKNMQLTGLCDFNVNNFSLDIDTLHYDVDIVFNQIRVNATYDVNMYILVPIVHQGGIYITADNVEAKVTLDFKITTKDSKRYTYLAKLKINLDVKNYNAQFDLNEDQFSQLLKILENFIGQNQEEIIKSLKPALEEAISKQVILISNGVAKHFPYEELFLE